MTTIRYFDNRKGFFRIGYLVSTKRQPNGEIAVVQTIQGIKIKVPAADVQPI